MYSIVTRLAEQFIYKERKGNRDRITSKSHVKDPTNFICELTKETKSRKNRSKERCVKKV